MTEVLTKGFAVVVGGYGFTKEASGGLLAALAAEMPDRQILIMDSLRWGGPITKPHSKNPLDLQAAHLADFMTSLPEGADVVIVAHSAGASIALRAKAWHGIQFRRLILADPANMYWDFFPWLALRIVFMVACDLFSPGGRQYWSNSFGYFQNVWRSLYEGLALSVMPVPTKIRKKLAASADIRVYQIRYDGVFSNWRTKLAAKRGGIPYILLQVTWLRWVKHNWLATHPKQVVAALRDKGAFNFD